MWCRPASSGTHSHAAVPLARRSTRTSGVRAAESGGRTRTVKPCVPAHGLPKASRPTTVKHAGRPRRAARNPW
eukprot:1685819-Prymnesium_polylepis.1